MVGPRRLRTAKLSVPLAILLALPVGLADHPQPTPTSGTLTFDPNGGNEWWIEVRLTGKDECTLRALEARDDGGAWVPLKRPSWAACNYFAGSFHIEPGHRIQFRALVPGSDTAVTSCWFTHPAGVEQCETQSPFQASFKPKPGNEWWVEVVVDANRPVASVDARVADGPWKPLTKRSWSAWAASFHVPDYSYVQFRARDAGGIYDFDTYAYFWPSASSFPSPGEPSASFEHVGGNDWWVQTTVYSNFEPTFVQARIDQGSWKALTLQTWGDWASSINVPAGSQVRFRAGYDNANAITSFYCFEWPEGRAAECDIPIVDPSWPKEGSYVKYETDSGMGVPGYAEDRQSQVTLTFRAGQWTGTCTVRERVWRDDELTNDTTTTMTVSFSPPAQTRANPGASITSQYIDGCNKASENLVAGNDTTHAIDLAGGVRTVKAHRGTEAPDESAYRDHLVLSDQNLGIVMHWGLARLHSGDRGRIVDTDAPLGPQLSVDQQRAMFGTWPVEGSHVEYSWCRQSSDYGCDFTNWTSVHLDYRQGSWSGYCSGRLNDADVNRTVVGSPPMAPANARTGDSPMIGRLSACEFKTTQVTVNGTATHGVSGSSYRDYTIVEVVTADQPTWSDKDKDARWDIESRLVVEWKYGSEQGFLSNADAPFV